MSMGRPNLCAYSCQRQHKHREHDLNMQLKFVKNTFKQFTSHKKFVFVSFITFL